MSRNRTSGDDTTKESVRKGCHLLKNSRLFLSLRGISFALIEGHPSLPPPRLRIWTPCTTQYFKKKKAFIFLKPLRGTLNWQEKTVRKLWVSARYHETIYICIFFLLKPTSESSKTCAAPPTTCFCPQSLITVMVTIYGAHWHCSFACPSLCLERFCSIASWSLLLHV